MERGLLIAGRSGTLFANIVQGALDRRGRVVATREPEVEPEVPEGLGENLSYVPWSPRSLFSARTLVLTAMDRLDTVDDVIVLMTPEGVHSPFHQTESALIEKRIDDTVKGYLFLVKEGLAHLMRAGGGRLVFVLSDGGAEVLPPVDAVVQGGLVRLVDSLFTYYADEAVEVHGLHASGADDSEAAAWVFDALDSRAGKTAGRWVRFGQRTGIFGGRR